MKEVIGDCTLLLGDCLDIMPTLDSFDHVICDPPYEDIMHKMKSAASSRKIRTDNGPQIKNLDFASIELIRQPTIDNIHRICNGWSLIFCTPEGVAPWRDAIEKTDAKYKRACIWIKPDSTPQLNGQGPGMGAENFIATWHGKGYSKWNAGGKRGVYTHLTNNPDREGTHPTEKPIKLMAELVKDFTSHGEHVLDPFMGSGTTGVACVKLGRKFTGIELDQKYFDVACKRIEEAYRQGDMFNDRPAKVIQEILI